MVLGDQLGTFPDSIEGTLQAMDEGYCEHAVFELDMLTYQLATDPSHCNKAAFGTGISKDLQVGKFATCQAIVSSPSTISG